MNSDLIAHMRPQRVQAHRLRTTTSKGGKLHRERTECGNLRRVSTELSVWTKSRRILILRLQFFKYLMNVCVRARVRVWPHETPNVWSTKDNLLQLVLSFLHVGSGDDTQVIRLGFMQLYKLSHLTDS